MGTGFKGLSGISDILGQRQQKLVEEKIYNDDRMEGVVDLCRQHVLSLYQQGKEYTSHALEAELVKLLVAKHPELSLGDRTQIARSVRNELEGYGPLEDLMKNKTITDIVVTAPDKIVYEQDGKLIPAKVKFRSEAHLRLFVERLCYLGRRKVDESNPSITVTLREDNGEAIRVAISIPPLTEGVHLAIRKFVYISDISGLVPETFSASAAEFLKLATRGRLNMVISGIMGAGKTTLIAVLGHEFDPLELPILVEEVRECPLKHPYLRNYVARPANLEGKGEIKFDYILKHALQTRATRILIAEVRDGAIFYMLRAMATGQSCMCTLHAEDPRNAAQVQIPMLMGQSPEAAGMDQASRNLIIGSAVDLIVQMGKEYDPVLKKDKRVCTHISEVQLSHGEPVEVKDIFIRRGGELIPTGYIPKRAIEKMAKQKVVVPLELFKR